MFHQIAFLLLSFSFASGSDPIVECPAPRSPEGGQAFVQSDGQVVKYACDPGYSLIGKEVIQCINGLWEDDIPLCVEQVSGSVVETKDEEPSLTPPRGLFNWDDKEYDSQDTEKDEMQGDQYRIRTVLIPGRRAQLRSASGNNRRRNDRVRVVSLQAPPSVLYVRRTGKSGDQDQPQEDSRRVALHSRPEGPPLQVVQLPRAAALQNDKGEDNLRHMYWMAANYYRQPSLLDGSSYLSESQINWIYSLPPELRDRYLRDLYGLRADEAAEGERAHAFLRRYGDYYHLYNLRHQIPVDSVSLYDYSCNQAGYPFVRAPKVPDAHIARYDRRQNPTHPRNHYLTAVYTCNPGYRMVDDRFTELNCSDRRWVGTEPICVPRT